MVKVEPLVHTITSLEDMRYCLIDASGQDSQVYLDQFHALFGETSEPLIVSGKNRLKFETEASLLAYTKEWLFRFDESLSESGRITSGSYYTPIELVRSLWYLALSQTFSNSLSLPIQGLIDFFSGDSHNESLYQLLRSQLETLHMIDIAAGSGQMLIGYIDVLNRLDLQYCGQVRPVDCSRFVLADIHREPLEAALLVLNHWMSSGIVSSLPQFIWGDSLDPCGPLTSLSTTLTFDIVIGNPPYLGEKSNRELFDTIKRTEWGRVHYEGKMDLFYFFIYKGLELLAERGVLAYITTQYFVTADGAKKLRGYLKQNARILGYYHISHKVFKSAQGQDNCFFTLGKGTSGDAAIGYLDKSGKLITGLESVPQRKLYTEKGNLLFSDKEAVYRMADVFSRPGTQRLNAVFQVNQGLVSGFDRLKKEGKEYPVFVFEADEIQKDSVYFKPFYKNSDINPYRIRQCVKRQILYLTTEDHLESNMWEWQHLSLHKGRLSERREFQSGLKPWYALHWPREIQLFESPKIVAPQRSNTVNFAFVEEPFYASADVYYITHKDRDRQALFALLAYLNSSTVAYYLHHFGKRKGKGLELYGTPLSQIPLPRDESWIQVLSVLGEAAYRQVQLLSTLQPQINAAVYQLMHWNEQVISEVESFYEPRRYRDA